MGGRRRWWEGTLCSILVGLCSIWVGYPCSIFRLVWGLILLICVLLIEAGVRFIPVISELLAFGVQAPVLKLLVFPLVAELPFVQQVAFYLFRPLEPGVRHPSVQQPVFQQASSLRLPAVQQP